jgi:hypothetical protein
MASMRDFGILAEPPGPGYFATCPNCSRRFALKLEATVADEKVGALRMYLCKHCGTKVTFADQHPPGCI